MNYLADLLESWQRTWREVRTRNVEAREKCAIAKAFNDRYCYRHQYPNNGKYSWMCPDCNRIHATTGCSSFCGLQYPKCCGTFDGNRLGMGIRTL